MISEETKIRRSGGIGGSDISALLGVSNYSSPYELWLKKTGRYEESEDGKEIMLWGNLLEDTVAKEYARRECVKVQRINTTLEHPECSIAIANLDRVIVDSGSMARWTGSEIKGASKGLEVKTANAFMERRGAWGDELTDQVPLNYFLQCQWYMGISKITTFDLACLFGGNKLKKYIINADQSFFDDAMNEAGEWWERHVKTDTPPAPTSESEARLFWQKHSQGREVILTDEQRELFMEFKSHKETIKSVEGRLAKLADQLFPVFEDAEIIKHGNEILATYRNNKDSIKTDFEKVHEKSREIINTMIETINECPPEHREFAMSTLRVINLGIQEAKEKNTNTKQGPRVFRLK